MTDALVPIGDGHTALSEDDRLGLLPTYIATRGELFEAEQRNVAEGMLSRHPTSATLLDDTYLRQLHRAMFARVWRWAGTYRTRETNIGIDPIEITVAVRDLVRDATAWVECGTYEPNEWQFAFTTGWSPYVRFRTATDVTAESLPTSSLHHSRIRRSRGARGWTLTPTNSDAGTSPRCTTLTKAISVA